MYSLRSVAILHRTYINRELTPADILEFLKYGYKEDNRFICVTVRNWGTYPTIKAMKNALKDIPKIYFQTYLESVYDDKYNYIYEGVILEEDGRPICYYNEPYTKYKEVSD